MFEDNILDQELLGDEKSPLYSRGIFEHQCRLGIIRFNNASYEAEILNEFSMSDDALLVKDLKVTVPQSMIETIGLPHFGNFMVRAFKLMTKLSCEHPLDVLKPLRKRLRKLKLKLLRHYTSPDMLRYFLDHLNEMVKDMWTAAKVHRTRLWYEHRQLGKVRTELSLRYVD